ncbi:DNA-binding protein [Escherichia coli]
MKVFTLGGSIIEEGDTEYFFKALGNIARARNISQLSKDAGM